MQQNIRDQIDWEQPFPAEEYAERRAKVQAALARDGLSGILVTEPRDIYYLTGHDHIWQYKQGLTALFLETQDGERLFIDSASHKVIVSTTPEIQDVIYYPRGKAMDHTKLIADAIAARAGRAAPLLMQPWGYGPHPDLVRAIGERLEAAGAEVVDRSYLVEDVRLVKSPREQVLTRQAASIANHALGVARDAIRPGMRETELEAVLCSRADDKRLRLPGHTHHGRERPALGRAPQRRHPPDDQERRHRACGLLLEPAPLSRQLEPQLCSW